MSGRRKEPDLHLFRIPDWFNVGFDCVVALVAFWRGAWRARAIAACQVVLDAWSFGVCLAWACWGPGRPSIMAWRPMGEHAVLLAVCLACVWRTDRYWVLWAGSLALLSIVTDTMSFIPEVSPWASGSANLVWSYSLNATVLVGVWPSVRARWRPAQ